ncbi:MAG TPA: AAA domain-containing protein, partial [Bacteroidales bacterium]|nr:AAA domain-containing protein [Bacteroidales bacterium]
CERSVPNAFLTKLQSNIGIRLGFIEKRIEEIHDRKLFLHNEPILKDDEIEIPWNKVVGRFLQAKLHNGDQSLRDKLEDHGFSIDEYQLSDTNNSLKSLEEKSQKVTHKDLLRFLSDGAIKNENPSNLRRQLNSLLEKNIDELDTFIHKYDDHLTETKNKLFKRIDKQIKDIDSLVHNLEELLNKLNTQRLFQKRDWRFSIANMLSHISKKIRENVVTFNKIPDVLHDLQNRALEIDLKLFNEDIPDSIPKFIDWRNNKEEELNSLIESLLVIKHQLLNKLSDQSILNIHIDEDILSEFKKRVKQFSKFSKSDKIKSNFRSANIRNLIEAKKALSAFFEVSNAFLEADNDGFLNHLSWQTTFREQTNNLKELIKLFQQESVGDWHIQFEEFFLNELLSEKIDLNRSSGYDSELKSLEEEREKLRKDIAQRIPRIWFYMQTQLRPKLPMSTLYNKRGSKGRRRNSLRKIIKTDFKTFTAYYPVVMVNPSVCASIIPLQPELFDLVIFDEASQLKVEESLSTLIRGKRKIVSGDKNQMPPSYWFTSNGSDEMTLEDEIDDNSDDAVLERYVQNETARSLADSESLLEFAEHCDFKQYYLDFHYRSRHPLLIQFSNAAFYKNRLYPLPERIPNPPIQFFRINGLYEHRQNKEEAETVISILKQLKRDKEGKLPSVGIATFNLQQRNFIWDLIKMEIQTDNEFQNRFTELESDGLFIKNLENIQGDERDIIIISTTFGIRSDGRYTANYGPLTRKDIGRRLLNVIITRAKMKVFVLTSIPEERCLNYKNELSGSNIVEGGYLHAYLCYAKAVSEGDRETIHSLLEFLNQSEGDHSINNFTTESPFEDAVMEALLIKIPEDRIVTQYRAGGFRIDIAVRSKLTGKPYIAIECDGATYHGSLEDYAWDIYRQKRLEEHGFVFHRIWSRDWWENSDRELDKLVKFIQLQDSKEINVESKRDPITEHLQLDTLFNRNGNAKEYEELPEKESIDFKEIPKNEIPNHVLKSTEESHKNNGYLKNDGALIKVGSKVKVKYLDNNKVATLKISHGDQKFKKNNGFIVVSDRSPIGVAALGRKVGDKFEINGLERYCEVLEVN